LSEILVNPESVIGKIDHELERLKEIKKDREHLLEMLSEAKWGPINPDIEGIRIQRFDEVAGEIEIWTIESNSGISFRRRLYKINCESPVISGEKLTRKCFSKEEELNKEINEKSFKTIKNEILNEGIYSLVTQDYSRGCFDGDKLVIEVKIEELDYFVKRSYCSTECDPIRRILRRINEVVE